MKRARQRHQKAERREAILAAALETLGDTPFHAITMAQVAARISLAKGTLYLYFATKEELFLELLRDQFHGWFWDLEAGLEELPRSGRLEAAARLIAQATASRPAFQILLGVCHGTLEPNLPAATAQAFHREHQVRVAAMGPLLERALPFLRKGEGVPLLLQLQVLATGWQSQSAQDQAWSEDLAAAFQTNVQILLAGWRDTNRRAPAESQPLRSKPPQH
jgi:AcrR family transcriptional regulator